MSDRWPLPPTPARAGSPEHHALVDERPAWIRRRWVEVACVGPEVAVVARVESTGSRGGFDLWVVELATGRTFADLGRRGLAASAHAVGAIDDGAVLAHAAGIRLRRADHDAALEILVMAPALAVELRLGGAGRGLVLAPRGVGADGEAFIVEREHGLGVSGRVRVGGDTRALGGGATLIERGEGALPLGLRASSALLLGRPGCFLSDAGGESACWSVDGAAPRALGATRLALADPSRPGRGPWTVASSDGRVALGFRPRAVRTADGGARVLGTFDGEVDGQAIADRWGLCAVMTTP